ncbi:MAG: pentapeptide repeat-containing protein, partial [Halobacteria archaeon]|nr:pentapeptide repeat-containing protein [Halobacteria archaeon]
FLKGVNSDDPDKNRFIGAVFGDLILEQQEIGKEAGDVVDLRHVEVNGTFNLSNSVVQVPFLVDCSEFKKLDAPNSEFEDRCTFREGVFEGEVNFDGAVFGGEANFRQIQFDMDVEFSDAEFHERADFRYSEFEGVKTSFNSAVFDGDANFNGCRFDEVHFTRAKFGTDASFSNVKFFGVTEFQYVRFEGESDFYDVDFMNNTKFRGVTFEGSTEFRDSVFKGWVSFRDCTYNADADYANVRFSNNVTFVASSDNKGTRVNLTGINLSSATFEIPEYRSVTYNFTRATVGNINVSTAHEDQNPFKHFVFSETKFDGFDFSKYVDELKEVDWEIHKDDATYEEIEETYDLARMGAKAFGNRKIANKFKTKKLRLRREKYQEEGDTAKWLTNLLYDVSLGYGGSPIRIVIVVAVILALAAVAFVMLG